MICVAVSKTGAVPRCVREPQGLLRMMPGRKGTRRYRPIHHYFRGLSWRFDTK